MNDVYALDVAMDMVKALQARSDVTHVEVNRRAHWVGGTLISETLVLEVTHQTGTGLATFEINLPIMLPTAP